jgi:hypothetical protein
MDTLEQPDSKPKKKSIWADLVTFSNDVWLSGPCKVELFTRPDGRVCGKIVRADESEKPLQKDSLD